MAYNLVITDRAEDLVDNCLLYLVKSLNNMQAAQHFLSDIETVYERLRDNPYQYADSKDEYLRGKGCKEAIFPEMNYKVIYKVGKETVYVVGVYNDLENHTAKIII